MIPGFDKAVTGMAVGEEKTVTLSADDAYGPYHPDLVVSVNRSENFSVENPVVGEYLAVTNPSTGATNRVKILNVTPSTVTVDANFELAGQNLTFTIKPDLKQIVPTTKRSKVQCLLTLMCRHVRRQSRDQRAGISGLSGQPFLS